MENHFVGLEEELEEGLLNGVLIGSGSCVLFRDSLQVFQLVEGNFLNGLGT